MFFRGYSSSEFALIHDYGGVDYEIVWQTITEDVPGLLAKLKPMLGGEP